MILTSTPFDPAHPDVLAIYCSDGRYTQAVEDLAARLGDSRVDVMCLPGGPGLFDIWSASALDVRMMEEAAGFLITGHRTRKVLLVAHDGCGFYARRYAGLAPEARRERQEADVRRAGATLRAAYPHLEVCSFFAVPSGSQVGFDPIV
jgi:hypothetical protein